VVWGVYCLYYHLKHQRLPALQRDTLLRLNFFACVLAILVLALWFWVSSAAICAFVLPMMLVQQEWGVLEQTPRKREGNKSKAMQRATVIGLCLLGAAQVSVFVLSFFSAEPGDLAL